VPSFTGTLPGLQQLGPVIQVTISVVDAAAQALKALHQPVPSPVEGNMMIDTGAGGSVVAPGIAARLGLKPVGMQTIGTPATPTPIQLPTFAVRLTLPNGPFFEITAIEAPLGGQAIDGVIGRDVLAQCVLIYIGYMNQFTLVV
jgi:Aspartyl protease